jgi:NAD(P)-dependent dehydrogenase (short-subunit alcohol dehydrogenase family)
MKSHDSRSRELAQRTALVTGAGRGLGRGIALELAAMGAHVVLCGRTRSVLDETAEAIERNGGHAAVLVADITARNFTAELDRVAPQVDVVVHNATSFPPYGALEDVLAAEIVRVHEVAVLAPMRITAHVLGGMKERSFGRIVFLGSIAASTGAIHQAPYASAKSALSGLVKSLALECAAHGVTCNLVEPGLVLTERVLEAIPSKTRDALIASTPMGRSGTVEEIAAVVGFLASPRASYVTGACIPVTGGLGLGLM